MSTCPLVILRSLRKFTLSLVVALMANQFNHRLHLMMMGFTFATVPVLIVFFFASRQFIPGLTAGALKGCRIPPLTGKAET